MTTAISREVDSRHLRGARPRRVGRPIEAARQRQYFAHDLAYAIREVQLYATRVRFPNPTYQQRPVEFCREVLGIDPWAKQVEVLEAVRDHPRVAVRSGHKVGKSAIAACLALWFYCSFEDARAVMTSTTSRQVDQILWRELRMLRARSGRCLDCKRADPEALRIPRPCPHSNLIEGEQGELARTGLKSSDFREVVGFTAREAEAVAGVSGRNLLYIADEASGIADAIFEAIEGNRAGGARLVLLGNPTQNQGEFYEAFASKRRLYVNIGISSADTPNAQSGQLLIPGLATREWIAEKADEWGEDSALYKVRVLGEFATREDLCIFSVHTIGEAEARWANTADAGRLYLGMDPAGESGRGDETAWAARRGLKLLGLATERGLTAEGHVTSALRRLAQLKLPREVPVLVVDREGPIGTPVYRMLGDYLAQNPNSFELVGVRASSRAVRQPRMYDRMRDELCANLEAWFRDGGAIPEDSKLAHELHVLQWIQQANGKLKLIPKDKVRQILGRSPDRYDALTLAAWEPLSLREAPLSAEPAMRADIQPYEAAEALDPWAGSDTWRAPR